MLLPSAEKHKNCLTDTSLKPSKLNQNKYNNTVVKPRRSNISPLDSNSAFKGFSQESFSRLELYQSINQSLKEGTSDIPCDQGSRE